MTPAWSQVTNHTPDICRSPNGNWSHRYHPDPGLHRTTDPDLARDSRLCPNVSRAPEGSISHPDQMTPGTSWSSDTDMVQGGQPDPSHPYGPRLLQEPQISTGTLATVGLWTPTWPWVTVQASQMRISLVAVMALRYPHGHSQRLYVALVAIWDTDINTCDTCAAWGRTTDPDTVLESSSGPRCHPGTRWLCRLLKPTQLPLLQGP